MENVKQLYSDCAFPNKLNNAFPALSEIPSSHCSSPSSCLMGARHVWGRWPGSALGMSGEGGRAQPEATGPA